jgi:hypothetical protein
VVQLAQQAAQRLEMRQAKRLTRQGNNMTAYFDADSQTWKDDAAQNMTPAIAPIAAPATPVTQPQAPNPIAAAANASDSDLALLASIKRSPGTPGVTQAQLQQNATQGVSTPTSQVNSFSGASPEALDKLQEAADARVEAIHNQSIAEKLQANANLDNASAQAVAARQIAENQAFEQQSRDAEWQTKWQQFQEQNGPENNQVDPNRFFSRAGVLGSIMAIVGSMFEAKAAALGHTQNPQTLMRLIDNDIRAQQLDLMQKGQSANNKFAQLSREYGSVEAGRAALKTAELQAVETKLRETAAQTNDPALKAHIDAQAAQASAAVGESAAQFRAAHEQVATQQQSAVMYPQKARGGGVSVDYGKYLAGREKIAEGQRADQKLNQEKGGVGEQSDSGRAERLGGKLAELQQVMAATENYYKSVGLEMDPKTGKYKQTGDHPLFGAATSLGHSISPEAWHSADAQEAEARKRIAVEAYGRSQSGAAISESELKNFDHQIAGTSGKGAAAAANAFRETMLKKIQTLRAGAGPGATQKYDSQFRNENQRQSAIDSVQPYQPKVTP